MTQETLINLIISLGITSTNLAIGLGVRAARVQSWPTPALPKLEELALSGFKMDIYDILQKCFDIHYQIPAGRHFKFCKECPLARIAVHIQGDQADLASLQVLYENLNTYGTESEYFVQGVNFLLAVTPM